MPCSTIANVTVLKIFNGMLDMKTWTTLILAALLLVSANPCFAQKPAQEKVYRWVDEDGNVHYTESLPPDFKDKKADVLDDQGITRETDLSLVPPPPKPEVKKEQPKGELPRDKSGLERPEPLYNDAQMQQQKDALLVLRYHSEEEIQDALDVEVRQLAYDSNLLITTRKSLDTAYAGTIKELADRQRAGVALPPEEIKTIEAMKRKMAANDLNMEQIRQRELATQEKFAADLERYRYLVKRDDSEQP
jgi:hypothetical protein